MAFAMCKQYIGERQGPRVNNSFKVKYASQVVVVFFSNLAAPGLPCHVQDLELWHSNT